MATACLFIGWNRPVPGREEEAYSFLSGEGKQQLDAFQKAGWFERTELIGLTPHGGDLNGFMLCLGERAKLDELRRTDEFERFVMRLGRNMLGLGVIPGLNWEGIQRMIARTPETFGKR